MDALENLENYRQSHQRVQQQKSEEKRPSQPEQEGHFQSQQVSKVKKQVVSQKGNLKTNNP